jgi:hypothetical protein
MAILNQKYLVSVSAFKYTLENSRPATGIASAWAALHRLGLNGLRQYLIRLMECSEAIKFQLKQYPEVSILNEKSRGWEIIFRLQPVDLLLEKYGLQILLQDFYRYVNQLTFQGINIPSISLVKDYANDNEGLIGIGLIWYPMSAVQTHQQRQQQVKGFMNVFFEYQQLVKDGVWQVSNKTVAEPIR